MRGLVRGLVRGYRRLAAQLAPPQSCPICLDALPVIGQAEAASGATAADVHVRLRCRHKFCADCVGPYVVMKVRAREVDDDQLVCPVVECKAPLTIEDITAAGGPELTKTYTQTLQRLRDEKNPNARWCPRLGCEELIICEVTDDGNNPRNFTCPKCAAVGCFRCRGPVHHRLWPCKRGGGESIEDKSYREWEQSLGGARAVRSCPQCNMRIWKNEGCNHMTCTRCRHEFCWVCASRWDASHYSCYDLPLLQGLSPRGQRLAQQLVGYASIVLIVVVVVTAGFWRFVGMYALFVVVVNALQRHIHDRDVARQQQQQRQLEEAQRQREEAHRLAQGRHRRRLWSWVYS